MKALIDVIGKLYIYRYIYVCVHFILKLKLYKFLQRTREMRMGVVTMDMIYDKTLFKY